MSDPYMDDIYSDINRKKQLEDAQKNKEFDDAVAGGTLEDLREGVKIRQREKSEIKSDLLKSMPTNSSLIKSIGYEIGANLALDKATNWFLGAPFPGARIAVYPALNFLGSSYINIQAQKMRGEENIKWGEAAGSGVASLIPYMNPAIARYEKIVGKPWSIQRGFVGGSVTGAVQEGIRIYGDEQRVPTLEETALGASVGGLVGGGVTTAAVTGKRLLSSIKGTVPGGDLAYGLGGTGGAAATQGSTGNKWSKFGYYADYPEPSQINNPRFTSSQKRLVEDNLEDFYNRVVSWERTGRRAKDYPLYWINPVTNDVYRAKRLGRFQNRRLSLESKNRYFRERFQSSVIQKKVLTEKQKRINRRNNILKTNFRKRRKLLIEEIDSIDNKLKGLTAYRSGQQTGEKFQIIRSIQSLRESYVRELEDLLAGRVEVYGEHGYNLANQRVQKITQNFPNSALGDAKNFHPTLNKDGFKEFKDKLENVINSTNRRTGVYDYPNLIVNYNPNLHNGTEYIIRIERANTIRMGGPDGRFPGVLYGDLAWQTPNGINYYDIPIEVRSGNTRDIRRWLDSLNYNERPDPAIFSDLEEFVPMDPRPKRSKTDVRESLLDE